MIDSFITPIVSPRRILNYSGNQSCRLSENVKHQFANQFALKLYRSGSVYSFIPRNASSTMRFSVAMDNGVVNNIGQINWIYENNETFATNLESLITANYTFTILRCPYERLLSCYLDKIVGLKSEAWNLHKISGRNIPANRVTFYDFVLMLEGKSLVQLDMHWRPQVDFLVYKEYDDYFAFEDFAHLTKTLKEKIDLDVFDTRDYLGQSTSQHEKHDIDSGFFLTPLDLQPMLENELIPTSECMYNDELIDLVYKLYGNDIDFYKYKFGSENLLFD